MADRQTATTPAAQPSPGGQGDALLESLVARWRNHAEEIGASNNVLCQKVANCTMRHAAELQAALAARQPVGEPPFSHDMICGLQYGIEQLRDIERGQWKARDWDCSDNYVSANIGHAKKAAAHVLPHLTAAVCAMADLWHSHNAAPPAQAVDLGAVREALQAAEGLATVCASVDGYSREEVAASGRAMRQQFADALAKVDSKAVGK